MALPRGASFIAAMTTDSDSRRLCREESGNAATNNRKMPSSFEAIRSNRPITEQPGSRGLTMNAEKRKALEAAGFQVGNTAEFLKLSAEEQALVELRLAIGRHVRLLRERQRLSQLQLATRIHSSQSRVAKIEAAAPGVSLDLAFRSFFAVGGKLCDLELAPRQHRLRPRTTRRLRAC
jgi:ribosome-binding protein aMBF1 (putative translation factor)